MTTHIGGSSQDGPKMTSFGGKKAAPFVKGGARRKLVAKAVLETRKRKSGSAKLANVALVGDVELAGKWRHGWIPLDATAIAIKNHKGIGTRRSGGAVHVHDLQSGEQVRFNGPGFDSALSQGHKVIGVRGGRLHTREGGVHRSFGPGMNDGRVETGGLRGASEHARLAKQAIDTHKAYRAARDAEAAPKAKPGANSRLAVPPSVIPTHRKPKAPRAPRASKDTPAKAAARDELTKRLDGSSSVTHLGNGTHQAKDVKVGQAATFHPEGGQQRKSSVWHSDSGGVHVVSINPETGKSELHSLMADHRGRITPGTTGRFNHPQTAKNAVETDRRNHARSVATQTMPTVPAPKTVSLREHFANMTRATKTEQANRTARESQARLNADHAARVKAINSTSQNVLAYPSAAHEMQRKGLAIGDRVALPTGSHTIVGLSKNGKVKLTHDSTGALVRESPSKMRLVARASARAKAASA